MAKQPVKKAAAKPQVDKKVAQFMRDHLEAKFVRAGWDKEKAIDMVACVSDAELCAQLEECCGPQRVVALGDGQFLKWLKDHKEGILSAVDKVFSLLGLLGVLKTGEQPEDDAEGESDQEETGEDSDSPDEGEDGEETETDEK